MLISINWLREFVEFTLPPEELAQTLTIAGFEVEEIDDRRRWAEGVVIGRVRDRQQHPNADKLSVCQVDVGEDEPLTIVCGAANVRADIYIPVARVKTYLPAIDLKLKKTKLRGVKSEGMICSLAELGLTKESDGIHIFPEAELPLGEPVAPLLGLDDIVLDLSSTANRADALSMVGVAREVAALTNTTVKLPETNAPEIANPTNHLSVQVAEAEACSAYIGTKITGVKIAPSPDWLKFRLQSAGVRPINNVVDITNYVLLEWGQPLHAFDADRLETVAGSETYAIGVRQATASETLTTLDDQARSLQPDNLLITANDQPIALAGVMGGGETEVHDGTTNLVLEAALFDPVAVRRSSRAQTLRTEASTRYERGVNPAELENAAQRAIALILELAGGTVVEQCVHDARPDISQRRIVLRLARLHQILGPVKDGEITAQDVETILTSLGCQLTAQGDDTWQVHVPPYRFRDLEREIDLIEEVARLYGYDNFCETLPKSTLPGTLPAKAKVYQNLRGYFRGVGLTELVHYSLVKPEQAQITISNPLLSEYSALRSELLTGLINAFAYNHSRGNGALNGFEIGRVFWREDEQLCEQDAIAGILGGPTQPGGQWTQGGKPELMTWYEAKGILEQVFDRVGLTVTYSATDADERLHPGRTATLSLGDRPLGIFGQLHPNLCREQDLPEAVYVFQLTAPVLVDAILAQGTSDFASYSTYPAVERDLAFFAPLALTVGDLTQVMTKTGKKLLDDVTLFDEYQGKGVPDGERSLAFSLAYRASDRTLTEADVEPVHEKIRKALVREFEVTLRS